MSRTRIGSMVALTIALAPAAACSNPIDAGGAPTQRALGDDPLAVDDTPPPGSLDALHRQIIVRSCAGQPGLCHHGQFEPNLSTPALAYANLVLRPSLEHSKQLRVAPGAPKSSLIIDKLRNNGVISRMPLGAPPLPEAEIAAIEAWIEGGALRRPGADPAPKLNNPPDAPLIGIFDAAGNRLDAQGPFSVAPATTLTFRHSVNDFETDDSAIPFAGFVLQTADQKQILIDPNAAAGSRTIGVAHYDATNAPEDQGEVLNYRWDYTVPTTVDLVSSGDGMVTQAVPTTGMALTVIAAYLDAPPAQGGMLTFSFVQNVVEVKP